jgi:hypothetical protein
VSSIASVPKWQRIRAILGGDFTPLHVAEIDFTSLQLPDGRSMELHTVESSGLRSLVPLRPPKPRKIAPVNNTGLMESAKQNVRDQFDAQLTRIQSIPDLVRGTSRKDWIYDYAMSRLPYHPQAVRNRTRFDAELEVPLDFGSEVVSQDSLSQLGSQPAPGGVVHARLLTPLDSMSSKPGEKVEAVLEQPLFSLDHKLVLPEGTRVEGSVASVKRAAWFHRGGRLRFSFQNVDLAVTVLRFAPRESPTEEQALPAEPRLQFRTQATLSAAENSNAPLKVDREGGVKTTESRSRLLGAAVAVLIARAAGDNDALHVHGGAITGEDPNIAGRTLGGGLGFGLLGSIAAQSSRNVGAALGYYGMAWTVFSTIVARGAEVQFDKNAVIDIGFNQRDVGKPANAK